MKACIYCRFCEYEEPYRYSSVTYDNGYFRCGKGKWTDCDLRDGELFEIAQECEHFDLTDDIKKRIAVKQED